MSRVDELDRKELVADTLNRAAHILGLPPAVPTPALPQLLSRHYTVFQVPSATTPNYSYFVVGSLKDGWRCSCIGFQAHGSCYHVSAVEATLKAVTKSRRQRRRRSANTVGVGERGRAKRGRAVGA